MPEQTEPDVLTMLPRFDELTLRQIQRIDRSVLRDIVSRVQGTAEEPSRDVAGFNSFVRVVP